MGSISEKCKKIKIVLTDVDGVLTDGGMYYTKEGDIMKRFHTRDGMGVTLLRKRNIPTIVITKEKTPMVKQWSSIMALVISTGMTPAMGLGTALADQFSGMPCIPAPGW